MFDSQYSTSVVHVYESNGDLKNSYSGERAKRCQLEIQGLPTINVNAKNADFN